MISLKFTFKICMTLIFLTLITYGVWFYHKEKDAEVRFYPVGEVKFEKIDSFNSERLNDAVTSAKWVVSREEGIVYDSDYKRLDVISYDDKTKDPNFNLVLNSYQDEIYKEARNHKRDLLALFYLFFCIILLTIAFFLFERKKHYKELYFKEKSLKEAEAKFKRIYDNTSVGIYKISLDGKFIEANPALLKILGYESFDDLKDVNIFKDVYLNEEDRESFISLTEKNGFVQGFIFKAKRRDGRIISLRASGALIEDEKKRYYQGIFEDITENVELEEKAKEKEELLKIFLNSTNEIVFLKDENLRYIFVNEANANFFKKPAEEIVFKKDEDFLLPEYAENCRKSDEEVLKRKKLFECEEKVGDRTFEVRKFPVKLKTGKFGVGGFIRDITDFKKSEEEREKLQEILIKTQKLETLGRLAGGIAHDFNNILTVIKLNLETLLIKQHPNCPIEEEISEIQKCAIKAEELTKGLLGFARKQPFSPKPMDLNIEIRNQMKMLSRLIGEDINFKFIEDKNIKMVSLDSGQISQILLNLCVNAKDAIYKSGKNGSIIIETKDVFIDEIYLKEHPEFKGGRYVMLSVSDDGCGMDEETKRHIFEPFYTTKEVGKGSGLGLATVFGIVKQNSGFINCYSEVGKGTTFKIYLPAFEGDIKPIREEEKKVLHSENGDGKIIVIVEDDETILNLLNKVLKPRGYIVISFSDPEVALNKSKDIRIDLLITDVILPKMNGKEVADKMRESHPRLRVLYMSGYTENVIVHKGLVDMGVYFIQKPFSSKQLLEKIEEALGYENKEK